MAQSSEPKPKTCRGCKQEFAPRNGHQYYCETCRPVKPAGAVRGRGGKGQGDLAAVMRQYVHRMVAEEVAAQRPLTVQAEVAALLRQVFGAVAGR